MKRIILFVLLALSVKSYADAPEIRVNCDNVKISMLTIDKNDFRFFAYWDEPTVFPNPPISKKAGKIGATVVKPFKFSCPDFQASFDGNIAEIKSNNYQSVIEHISEFDRDLDLYHYGFYRYPNIRKGLIVVDYSFDLEKFDFKTGIHTATEGSDLDESLFTSDVPKSSIIGYKVDGGGLKPFLYDRKISQYKKDFDQANTIDIYHKIPSDTFGIGSNIEREFIDKPNGILRMYIKSKFPSN